jgi:DNA polymerase
MAASEADAPPAAREPSPSGPASPAPVLFEPVEEPRAAASWLPEDLRGPVPAEGTARADQLARLAAFAAGCQRCGLAAGRRHVVFGSGDPGARLMFIGEGPGEQEDRQGLPFVGRAGELLTRILRAIGLTREQVYIANIVKCRPPGNRDPQPAEVAACRGYLERQIELIRPRILVALGRVAAQTLLGTDRPLGRLRGQWWPLFGAELRVTYHPAAILRNEQFKRPTWEDMQVVRDRLRELEA